MLRIFARTNIRSHADVVRFRRVCQNGSHPYGWLPFWCARRESNPEPTASEAVTLSNCATDTYLR